MNKDKLRFRDWADASVSLSKMLKDGVRLRGLFGIEVYKPVGPNRAGLTLVSRSQGENIITNEMLDHILNVIYGATAKIATWYFAPVESNTTPIAGLTYAVPTYTECTAYAESVRQEYIDAPSTARLMTNVASKAVITMNATKTLYGSGLVGGGTAPTTKGNTAGGGVLGNFALFAAPQAVQDAYVVNLTYAITSADDGV